MNILSVRNLKKYYNTGENTVKALDGIDLDICKGEFLAVVGTSGSGKSTLLHMLGGLDNPTSGEVIIDGKNISGLSRDELTVYRRRKIGFVFQNYNLLPLMNVYENIVLPIKLDGIKPDNDYIEEILKLLKLEDKKYFMPNQLSGGQQQRVALARALAIKPAIILADEPTGNLDSRTSQDVLGLIKISSQNLAQTIVMITHNEEIAQVVHQRVVHFMEKFCKRQPRRFFHVLQIELFFCNHELKAKKKAVVHLIVPNHRY
ncbi:MAG: ABC transporter ATP-binding protein [[Ruminococcus] torques]